MHMATMPMTPAWTCALGHGMTLHHGKTSTPLSILVEFEATEYSYSIFKMLRIFDLIFDLNEIPDLSHP